MPRYQIQGPSIDLTGAQIAVLEAEQVADFPTLTITNLLRRVVEAERMRDYWQAQYERMRAEQKAEWDRAITRLREDAA